MKGSIRARGKSYTAYWFVIDPGTGSRAQHSKGGFRTKGAAQEHLNEVLGKVQTNEWSPDRKMTVKQLLTEWLAAKTSEGLRPATLAQYSTIIDTWLVPHVGGVQVAKLSPKQAQDLVEKLRAQGGRNGAPLSSRSVQLSIIVLKAATTWAVETRHGRSGSSARIQTTEGEGLEGRDGSMVDGRGADIPCLSRR